MMSSVPKFCCLFLNFLVSLVPAMYSCVWNCVGCVGSMGIPSLICVGAKLWLLITIFSSCVSDFLS